MFALFLLAALAAIVYLMFWMIQNDGAKRIEDQKGLFRMVLPKATINDLEQNPKNAVRRDRFLRPPGAPPHGRRPSNSRLELAQTAEVSELEAEEEIVHPLSRSRHPRRRP